MKPDYSYKVTSKVKKYIEKNKMLGHGDSVVVGLSGGADSVCLFLLLNKLQREIGFTLHAVHINHCIRGNSADRDEEFSRKLCSTYDIPFKSYRVDVPAMAKKNGQTLEEAGRIVRYDCFYQYGKEISDNSNVSGEKEQIKIAVAHHMNDQAETVLFNIARGSGLKGISGMNPVSDRNIIRPLLCLTRNEIIDYLAFEKQDYCIDETNSDNDYSRNQIRNIIISELEKIQPRTCEHISFMADEVREAVEYMDSEVNRLASECVILVDEGIDEAEAYRIDVEMLKDKKPIIVRQIIIFTLKKLIENYKDITRIHIEDIYSLFSKGKGKYVMLPYNLVAKKERDYVEIKRL